MSVSQENYTKYRGKCKEMCQEMLANDSSLTLVRGWYYESLWNREEAHWWLKDGKGKIIDPTKLQFPSGGINEFYREFQGTIECEQCKKLINEEGAIINGRFAICSKECYTLCFVG